MSCGNDLAKGLLLLAIIKRRQRRRREQEEGKIKRKIWVKDWILKYTNSSPFETIYQDWKESDPNLFRRCLRLDTASFEELLVKITPLIQKENTNMRQSIVPGKRLALTLRFLATGESFFSLSLAFGIGQSTVGVIVPEVCEAIYHVLKENVKCPNTQEEWKAIARKNYDRWDYVNCIGALDGKHVIIEPPPRSGSEYVNYKGTFSIVLMALVDADIRCIFADAGINGRVSDGGVWAKTELKNQIDLQTMNIPAPASLPRAPDIVIPYHIVADDAFALQTTLMKPYSGADMRGNMQRRIFNYRLSRCRNRSENFFGILANRFQIYRAPIKLHPAKVEKIVLTTIAIHNWLRNSSIARQQYVPREFVDWEDIDAGSVHRGDWRNAPEPVGMLPIGHQGGNRTSAAAREMRDQLCTYYNSAGARDWQERMVV